MGGLRMLGQELFWGDIGELGRVGCEKKVGVGKTVELLILRICNT
jgi:hypothetical protein